MRGEEVIVARSGARDDSRARLGRELGQAVDGVGVRFAVAHRQRRPLRCLLAGVMQAKRYLLVPFSSLGAIEDIAGCGSNLVGLLADHGSGSKEIGLQC